ncbi:hypothetical protein PGTUg99_022512 [Puccinia graminis f. sp. tritici]|uniref:Uncharacterized protein n=1 Tax=Puccinia graminis f. sp. tritici TaxID=56615 RepID=A0A5B0S5I8_PUCGR|nr:hypothetical protein PGTUg99_022512 [Puccinia graminis f. sp. tritici]
MSLGKEPWTMDIKRKSGWTVLMSRKLGDHPSQDCAHPLISSICCAGYIDMLRSMMRVIGNVSYPHISQDRWHLIAAPINKYFSHNSPPNLSQSWVERHN